MYYIDWYAVDDEYEPNIGGQQFRRLLEVCFQQSDCFSLSVGGWQNRIDTMQQELEPHILKKKVTKSWFGYYPLLTDAEVTATTRILYPVNDVTKSIIEKYCDNLWLRSEIPGQTQSLEDLCFFSDDKLILGTVSHEYICQAYPSDDSFKLKLFEVYNHWKAGNDFAEQIRLSDYFEI
jgi:hypothetical protein